MDGEIADRWDVGDTVYFCMDAARKTPALRHVHQGLVVSCQKDRSVTCIQLHPSGGLGLYFCHADRGDWVSSDQRHLELKCAQTPREKAWNEI